MPVFEYSHVIQGTQSLIDGGTAAYGPRPPVGASWQYSGDTFKKYIFEADPSAQNFNGDPNNELIEPIHDLGGPEEQAMKIGGTKYAVIYDYEFAVTDGANVYYVVVWDVDLNGDSDVEDPGEDGTFLSFDPRFGIPPADTPLTIVNYLDNSFQRPHITGLGALAACFTPGTLIDTPSGARAVEDLNEGDLVLTRDAGAQRVVWACRRSLTPAELRRSADLGPVRIAPGALGRGLPYQALTVSPQHRMLLASRAVRRIFGADEVLVAATHLVGMPGIERVTPPGGVTYIHFMCSEHHLVTANGAPTESMYAGPMALAALEPGARRELLRLFPQLACQNTPAHRPARRFLTGREGLKTSAAHRRHARPLLEAFCPA